MVFPEDIDDGLPKVAPIPRKEYCWPFEKCGDFVFKRDDKIYKWVPNERTFKLLDPRLGPHTGTEVSDAFYLARDKLNELKGETGNMSMGRWEKGKDVFRYWKRVLELEVDANGEEKTAADYMFKAMALYRMSLFIENYDRILPDWFCTAWLDKQGALAYRNPASIILYAHCLVYGYGGIKRNITQGVRLLWYAGSQGFPQAYLNLGEIYEKGLGDPSDGRVPDKQDARYCFKMASKVRAMYDESQDSRLWKGILKTDDDLIDEMKEELPIWHETADVVGIVLGSRFNWIIGSQAFLFIAAVGLADVDASEVHRYLPLLKLLPGLGLVLAFFAIVLAIESIIRNGLRRREVYQLVEEKLKAYEAMEPNQRGAFPDTWKSFCLKDFPDTWKFSGLKACLWLAQYTFLILAVLFFVSWCWLLSTVDGDSAASACNCNHTGTGRLHVDSDFDY